MIINYFGNGKGKTTASIGLIIRYYSIGKKVYIIHFDKYDNIINEHKVFNMLNIPYKTFGKNRINEDGTFRFGYNNEDILEIKKGIEHLISIYENYDMILLDEFNIVWQAIKTLDYHYKQILNIFNIYKKNISKHIILTGMIKNEDLINVSDLSSNVQNIKHYFNEGFNAINGIEY